jgi:signal transduction histidine kinase
MKSRRPEKPKAERHPNVIGASARPIYDKGTFVEKIREMMPDSELMSRLKQTFPEGEFMLRENQENTKLYIILDGYVSQVKEGDEVNTNIGMQGPGDFIGLLSFQTGEPVFTSAKASTKVTTLALDHDSFEVFLTRYPEISKTLQGLIFSNLAERYRKVVTLHVEVAELTKQLEAEKNHLKKTIKELERTRNALISQEKMATLGELTAGLAHEINNPASALLRSVDYLITTLPDMAQRASALPDTGLVRFFFEMGLKREYADTAEQRARMKELAKKYPHIHRGKLRTMAEMDHDVLERLKPFAEKAEKEEMLQLLLDSYQSGIFMNGIRLSTARIEYLVKSLKSYSRQSGKEPEVADVREGIRETLQILGNRLKDIKVKIDFPEIPPVTCFVGELNQVWTNLIINACDAMNDVGELYISCGLADDNEHVWFRVADNGPGVPHKIKKRIFDSSFTTKTASQDFGLGIGLAITQSIVEKHHGTIEVYDRQGGGAEFVVTLPAER